MSEVHIVPAGHRVLVKPDDVEKTSKGGIIITIDDKYEKASQETGTVVKIGFQAWKAFCNEQLADGTTKWGEPWCKEGDKVIYVRHAGKRVKDPVTEIEYVLLNDADITGVIL